MLFALVLRKADVNAGTFLLISNKIKLETKVVLEIKCNFFLR